VGLITAVQHGNTCYYAVQDKVWVHGPGTELYEVCGELAGSIVDKDEIAGLPRSGRWRVNGWLSN
jgi:hypothetical protein